MEGTRNPLRGRIARWTILLFLLGIATACGDGGDPLEAGDDPAAGDPSSGELPLTDGSWYRPPRDVTWTWQLDGTVPGDRPVALYDVDLFEAPDALISSLHARGVAVVCYFSAGSWESLRPDADAFPASTRGKPLDNWPENWLDIRSEAVYVAQERRLRLAQDRGCDAVEPDNVDGYTNDTGFPLTATDQLVFNRRLANAAHRLRLGVALKNDGDQAELLVDYYDFVLNEECHAYAECDAWAPFLEAGKAVLNAEYADSHSAASTLAGSLCPASARLGLRTIVFPHDLDGSWEVPCW